MKIRRENYLQLIRPYYDVDLIKVITGVRRAGKSVLLEMIRDELAEKGIKGDHIIYLNLEDMDFDYIQNAQDLNREIKDRINDEGKYYYDHEIVKVPSGKVARQVGIFKYTSGGGLDRTVPVVKFMDK